MTILAEFFLDARAKLWGTRMGILLAIAVLTAFSILFVNSTTGGVQDDTFLTRAAWSQLAKSLVGVVALLVVLSLDYRTIERFAYVFYFVLLGVLLVLLTANRIAGVRRWFDLGFIKIQPSELMKVTLIVLLASYLRFRRDQRRLGGLLKPFLLTVMPMFLVVAQPDLGTSLMLPPILLAMLFVSGAKRSHIAVAVAIGVLLVPAMIAVDLYVPRQISSRIVKRYQAERVYAWLGLESERFGMDERKLSDSRHQLRQSLGALISGGWEGKGYGEGTRNRLRLLPAKSTDFIFAIVGEEWGLRGTAILLGAYLTLVLLCFNVSLHTREPYARLVATGVATLFAAQGLQNLAMTMGLTPITGLPLPFVSYGGSSVVASYVAAGLLLGIAFRPVRVMASQDLNPRDVPKAVPVVDYHPSGANRFPNGPY